MSKKVLLVDDDPTTIKMIQSLLQTNGFEVVCASDGEEGLAKVKTEQPNLIVLDVQMPKINGYAFIFELKQMGINNIPVIVLTAKEGMAEIFKVEGVKEYVIKPVNQEVLLEKIKKHIQ